MLHNSPECATNVGIMKEVFAEANLPTEPEKDEGPSTVIGMLGIELGYGQAGDSPTSR